MALIVVISLDQNDILVQALLQAAEEVKPCLLTVGRTLDSSLFYRISIHEFCLHPSLTLIIDACGASLVTLKERFNAMDKTRKQYLVNYYPISWDQLIDRQLCGIISKINAHVFTGDQHELPSMPN